PGLLLFIFVIVTRPCGAGQRRYRRLQCWTERKKRTAAMIMAFGLAARAALGRDMEQAKSKQRASAP
ncbi:MAG TPA: hypothetical protein VJT71_20765, partial [Pyrinomonadaceae bacterium]|nr:hypothetical protein [Pyrinomonadaceae bacterium]